MSPTPDRRSFLLSTAGTALWLGAGCDRGASSSSSSSDSGGQTRSADGLSPSDAASQTDRSGTATSGWGHLRGRFVFDGPAPKRKRINTGDEEFCRELELFDESLLVNEDNGGLENVVLFLYVRSSEPPPPPHSSYEESLHGKVVLNNEKTTFIPHVNLLLTTQTLVVTNRDPISDSIKIDMLRNVPVNRNMAAGETIELTFPKAERTPAHVSCAIHLWESAWLLVKRSPYFARTGPDGRFEIRNVPAGDRSFVVWHEMAAYVKQATVGGVATQWSRGRMDVTLRGDETTDLGEIHLSPNLFKAT